MKFTALIIAAALSGCAAVTPPVSAQLAIAKSEYAAKAWSLLETFVKAGAPDLIRIPAKTLAKAGFTTKAGGDVEKAAKPVIAYLGVMMKDALN